MKKSKKSLIRSMLLFLVILILTFYIIFKNQDVTKILEIIETIDLKYVLIGILCMVLYFICDAVNIRRTLTALGEKTNLFKSIKYTLIGFFFSAVTPAASGGQPMQIYYMNKDKISVANSTLTLLVNLTCMQIATISIALISLFFNYEYMNGVLIGCFILGILLNLSALALLLISILSKRMTMGIINFTIKFLKFIRVKNIEQKEEKINKELEKYHSSAIFIKNHKHVMNKTLLTTYAQFILYYIISYWVYRAFGLSSHNILQIASMQSVLFATTSGIPSPGAVGVSEGGFLEIFKGVYKDDMISGAMLLNRGINFYLFVLISAIIVMIYTVKDKKEQIIEEEETKND